MGNKIQGYAFVLQDNVDTDQILSGEYIKVNYSSPEGYKELGKLAMCGLSDSNQPFIREDAEEPYKIIIAGKNFGCGSSREHAVVALGSSGVEAVIAQSFARIFFRNCISTGEVLPVTSEHRLCEIIQTGDEIEIDTSDSVLYCHKKGIKVDISPLGVLLDLVNAGGLFSYARENNKF